MAAPAAVQAAPAGIATHHAGFHGFAPACRPNVAEKIFSLANADRWRQNA
jgi:hypothetical protein